MRCEVITCDDEGVLVKVQVITKNNKWMKIKNIDDETAYLNLSQIEIVSESMITSEVFVPTWLAEQVGLI